MKMKSGIMIFTAVLLALLVGFISGKLSCEKNVSKQNKICKAGEANQNEISEIDSQIMWVDKNVTLGDGFHYYEVYDWAHRQWDYNMTRFYDKLLKTLPDSEADLLTKSQADWIRFKESEFTFIDAYAKRLLGDGAGETCVSKYAQLNANELKMNIVKQRALELRESYQAVGGIVKKGDSYLQKDVDSEIRLAPGKSLKQLMNENYKDKILKSGN